MHIKMTLCGQELEIPPLKLKATAERIITEHKLEPHADRIADEVMAALGGKGDTLDPSKLAAELKIEAEEAGVLLAWVHFMCQYRMQKQAKADSASGKKAVTNEPVKAIFPAELLAKHQEAKNVGWFAQFDSVADHIVPKLKESDKILLIGCGEQWPEALRKAGFSDVHSIDIQEALNKLSHPLECLNPILTLTPMRGSHQVTL